MTLPLFSQNITEINSNSTVDASEVKFKEAVDSIRKNVLDAGYIPCAHSSYGKDSVVTLMACIQALKAYNLDNNTSQKLIVATSKVDGMESPIVQDYLEGQVEKLKAYAKDNNLDIEVILVSSSRDENYLLQMVGGKTIQCIRGKARCSIDSKQAPVQRLVKQVTGDKYVSILGTRFSESLSRSNGMKSRQESHQHITTDSEGRMTIPPIAEMTDDEVFEIIRKAAWFQMGIGIYSEFECPVDADAVIELYGKGSEHSCSTKAFLGNSDGDFDIGGTCSNMEGRYGCWMCGRCGPVDKKHTAIAKSEGYEWLQKFIDVREALMATEFNLDCRTWLSKRVDKEGYLTITPGSYSPEYCYKLLSWLISLREDTGYQVITDSQIVWVMIQWVRHGFPDAFNAVNLRNEIVLGGKRYYPTSKDMQHKPKVSIPEKIRVKVTDNEFGDEQYGYCGDVGKDSEFITEEAAKALFEYQWGEKLGVNDYSIINKMNPTSQLQILTAWASEHSIDDYKNSYDFTPARARGSKGMLQRANLLHRLGLREHLGDKEHLLKAFLEQDEFKLSA